MSERVDYEIVEEYGEVRRGEGQWPLKVRRVSWNGRPAKVDLRYWSPDDKPRKGITLTSEEARQVKEILSKI